LFVYILIAISQIVLRYRNRDAELRLKMWLFPVLSILTTIAMLAILVQMYLDDELRSQLLLSLLAWAVVVVLYLVNRRFIDRRDAAEPVDVRLAGAGTEQQPQQVGDGGGTVTDQQLSERTAHRGTT
jgi:GABA permease